MQDPNQCSQIRLTREECVKYDNAARKLLQDTVAERAKFNPTNIDSEHWAFVKRRKEVSIFNNVIGSAHPGLIVMIGTGLIDGKLEDVMGGLYSETTDEFQTSKILLGYDLKDGLVLNAHQRRTSEDPFRFAGIKWFAGRRAWGLLHDQNALTYERMGLTTDARGNEIAYHTLQSITRPEWPCEPTPNMLRQHTAVCYLYRRLMQTNKTEVFVWGSITKSRLVLERFFHFNVASTWLKIVDSPNVGRAKNFSTLIDKADSHQWLATSTTCHVCARKPTLGSYSHCSGCHQTVCKDCSEQHHIFQLSKSGRAKKQLFCALCVKSATDKTPFGSNRNPLLFGHIISLRNTGIFTASSHSQQTKKGFSSRTFRFIQPFDPFHPSMSSFDDETPGNLNIDW
ncbi:putative Zinc finger, FYVE/PHD-type, Zinc finger, RING/FYVE/PHD-type [Plasmopara halstedii]